MNSKRRREFRLREQKRAAQAAIQEARHAAHVAIDSLWRPLLGDNQWRMRDGVYRWLADHFGMTKRECHIRYFDIGMCEAVTELVEGAKAGVIRGPKPTQGIKRIRPKDRVRMIAKRLEQRNEN